MTAPILAWHGQPDLKAAAVARMHAHREADSFAQGNYAWDDADATTGYRGCFHGCLTAEALMAEQGVRSANFIRMYSTWHLEGERLWGIPAMVGVLLDRVFEALDPAECGDFAVNTVEAIPVGADLTGVLDRVAYDVLSDDSDGLRGVTLPDTIQRDAVDGVAELYRRRIAGDEPTSGEWNEARAVAALAYADSDGADGEAADVADDLCGDADPDDIIDARWVARDEHLFVTWLAARIVHHLAAAPVPASSGAVA